MRALHFKYPTDEPYECLTSAANNLLDIASKEGMVVRPFLEATQASKQLPISGRDRLALLTLFKHISIDL